MDNVKHIDIHLENCEVIRFSEEHVSFLGMKKDYEANERGEFVLRELFVKVSAEANTGDAYVTTWSRMHKQVFDRFSQNEDICIISVVDLDGSNTDYRIDWPEEDFHSNSNQSSYVCSDTGTLYLAVSETLDVFDAFKDEISRDTDVNVEVDYFSDIETWPTQEILYGIQGCGHDLDFVLDDIAGTTDHLALVELIDKYNGINDLLNRYKQILVDRNV